MSTGDDGGCSGRLRRERDMAPPGDLRRCLIGLARNQGLARRFGVRFDSGSMQGRSYGNLVLAALVRRTGSLQAAADRVARTLDCRGRVCPATDGAACLVAENQAGDILEGETTIADSTSRLTSLRVDGVQTANPVAVEAISRADVVVLGPGSFFTSVLACLLVPGIPQALGASGARKLYVANLTCEGSQTAGLTLDGYIASVRGHLRQHVPQAHDDLTILEHAKVPGERRLDDGTLVVSTPLADDEGAHSALHLAGALQRQYGLSLVPGAECIEPRVRRLSNPSFAPQARAA